MGNPFKSKTKMVTIPQQSTTQGSSEIKPYAPVVPYIESLLPQIQSTFTERPALFTESLVPQQTAATQQAYDLYGQVGAQSAALSPMFQNLLQQQVGIAGAAPGTSQLFQTEMGDILNQARLAAGASKIGQAQSAIEAGQFGLGSTARAEQEALKASELQRTTQSALAGALGREQAAQQAALANISPLAQQYLGATATQASLQEAIGRSQEQQRAAELADQARLAQQQQEAERLQITNLANLLGGLAGLGSQTSYQQAMQGSTTQAIQQPSLFQQIAGPAATIASAFA